MWPLWPLSVCIVVQNRKCSPLTMWQTCILHKWIYTYIHKDSLLRHCLHHYTVIDVNCIVIKTCVMHACIRVCVCVHAIIYSYTFIHWYAGGCVLWYWAAYNRELYVWLQWNNLCLVSSPSFPFPPPPTTESITSYMGQSCHKLYILLPGIQLQIPSCLIVVFIPIHVHVWTTYSSYYTCVCMYVTSDVEYLFLVLL